MKIRYAILGMIVASILASVTTSQLTKKTPWQVSARSFDSMEGSTFTVKKVLKSEHPSVPDLFLIYQGMEEKGVLPFLASGLPDDLAVQGRTFAVVRSSDGGGLQFVPVR